MARMLLIDDDTEFSPELARSLAEHGHQVRWLECAEEGLALLAGEPAGFDVLLLDQCMPRMHGLELLAELQRRAIGLPVLLFTSQGTADVAIRASKLGAFRYLPKPADLEPASLVPLLRLAEEAVGQVPVGPKPEDDSLLGQSEAMRALYEQIGLAAGHDEPVLILGEAGTGKETVARTVHRYGERGGPLVRVNCLAFDDERLEDELFGHEAGAYPEAGPRPGAFEEADGGAVLLDRFHLLGLPAQARIARLIREGVVQRDGRGALPREARVRVLACSGEDVRAALAARRIDPELYHLLERTTITVPPLRERGADVLLLADHFLRRAAVSSRRPARSLTSPARERLMAHDWPGNLPELQGVVRRAVQTCRRAEVGSSDLMIEPSVRDESDAVGAGATLPPSREVAYRLFLWAVEREPALAGRTDADVFRWLRNDPRGEGDGLPASCETFRRYLREARAHHGTRKNTPRAGRALGRSIVRADQV